MPCQFTYSSDQVTYSERRHGSKNDCVTFYPTHGGIAGCNYTRQSDTCLRHRIVVTIDYIDSGMYGVGEHEGVSPHHHYTSNPYQPLHPPPLTSSSTIMNYETSPHQAPSTDHQEFHDGQYKTEPTTPTCPNMSHSDTYSSYPTPFTPSPSLSGSESPRTPNPSYPSFYQTLEGGERLTVPFPAPTPPLSATHLSKDTHHTLPDTDLKFSTEQIDCICDSLQQRRDMATLCKYISSKKLDRSFVS